MFNTQHYNAIAKEIREIFPVVHYERTLENMFAQGERASLTILATNLAKRFKADNELFDPIKFLDACSPNVELYPLSELWEDEHDFVGEGIENSWEED